MENASAYMKVEGNIQVSGREQLAQTCDVVWIDISAPKNQLTNEVSNISHMDDMAYIPSIHLAL